MQDNTSRTKIRFVKLAVLAAAIALLTMALIGCGGGLNGTYSSGSMNTANFRGEKIDSISFESSGDAEMRTYSLGGITTWKDCRYTINGNSITIKAEWNYSDKHEETYSFRQSGDSIYLDDYEYRK